MMRAMRTLWCILCAALLALACGGEPGGNGLPGNGGNGGNGNGNGQGNGEEPEVPSWSEEIHPILWTRCQDCHRPVGGAGVGAGGWTIYEDAPDSYDGVASRVDVNDPPSSLLLLRAVNEGFHPVNPPRLSTEDGDYHTLLEWVAGGAPEN